jgi:hypothetical protein
MHQFTDPAAGPSADNGPQAGASPDDLRTALQWTGAIASAFQATLGLIALRSCPNSSLVLFPTAKLFRHPRNGRSCFFSALPEMRK